MKELSIPIRFGLVTSAVLIAYFLILALFDKHTHPGFSFFNAVITFFGIYEAIKVTKLHDTDVFTYGEGFKTGLITGFIATILFTAFFLLYASELDSDFIPEISAFLDKKIDTNVGMITAVVAIMGFTTTVICTLTIMQLFKKSNNLLQNQ
jgi:hypothetical protein